MLVFSGDNEKLTLHVSTPLLLISIASIIVSVELIQKAASLKYLGGGTSGNGTNDDVFEISPLNV